MEIQIVLNDISAFLSLSNYLKFFILSGGNVSSFYWCLLVISFLRRLKIIVGTKIIHQVTSILLHLTQVMKVIYDIYLKLIKDILCLYTSLVTVAAVCCRALSA